MFHHYIAIDAGGNRIGRCNLTIEKLRVHTSNLEVCGYIVRTAETSSPIAETDAVLIATVLSAPLKEQRVAALHYDGLK